MANIDTTNTIWFIERISCISFLNTTNRDVISFSFYRYSTEIGFKRSIEFFVFISFFPCVQKSYLVRIRSWINIYFSHETITMIVWRIICWSLRQRGEDGRPEWTNVFRTFSEIGSRCFFDSVCIRTERKRIQVHFENFFFRILLIQSIGKICFLNLSFYGSFLGEKCITYELLRNSRSSTYFICSSENIIASSTNNSENIDSWIREKCFIFCSYNSILYVLGNLIIFDICSFSIFIERVDGLFIFIIDNGTLTKIIPARERFDRGYISEKHHPEDKYPNNADNEKYAYPSKNFHLFRTAFYVFLTKVRMLYHREKLQEKYMKIF